ncbi:MAG: alpha,alpha-trehalose-phosphate synthase, partial [Steroidobacteraceae bacterium]
MARLVTISNRVFLPKGPSVSGGLAVGVLAAMRARGGLWFGWNGEINEEPAGEPDVVIRDG